MFIMRGLFLGSISLILFAILAGAVEQQDIEIWKEELVGKKLVHVRTFDPATEFTTYGLPKDTRIVKPGQGVTRDYRPTRLNILVDKEDVVTRVYYG